MLGDSRSAGALLGLSEPEPLGVILALVMGVCHSGGAEGRVTQLAVVVLRGQDDPAGALEGRLREREGQ